MPRIGSSFDGHAQDGFGFSNDDLRRLVARHRPPTRLCKSITIASFIIHTHTSAYWNDSGKLRCPAWPAVVLVEDALMLLLLSTSSQLQLQRHLMTPIFVAKKKIKIGLIIAGQTKKRRRKNANGKCNNIVGGKTESR